MEEGCVYIQSAYFLREDWRWRDCAKNSSNSTIYDMLLHVYILRERVSSKEAFVIIRDPLLCEFSKLKPFIIMATARGREEERSKMSKSEL